MFIIFFIPVFFILLTIATQVLYQVPVHVLQYIHVPAPVPTIVPIVACYSVLIGRVGIECMLLQYLLCYLLKYYTCTYTCINIAIWPYGHIANMAIRTQYSYGEQDGWDDMGQLAWSCDGWHDAMVWTVWTARTRELQSVHTYGTSWK